MEAMRRFLGLLSLGVVTVVSATPAHANSNVTTGRVGGDTRYATAAAIAQSRYPSGVNYATLTSGRGFADALGGAFLAGVQNGPILLTEPDHLSAETKDVIDRLGIKSIDILGGTDAVSQAAQDEIPAAVSVHRYEGATRYDTDQQAVEAVAGGVNTIGGVKTAVVASGVAFADAVAAGGLAYRGFPIVLTDPATLSPQAAATLQFINAKQVLIMGGPGAISPAVEQQIKQLGVQTLKRFSGGDRFDTAAQLARFEDSTAELGISPAETVLYRSDDFADSLAAAAYSGAHPGEGKNELPAGVGGSQCGELHPTTAAFLRDNAQTVTTITAVGGPDGVCQHELDSAAAAATG